ncbi:MAG: sulfite exporter TauE/SafE family protein [Myxococcales bacterium]|nr:sulfite exporter TauE/SafE family protein [Myxococcales bacterium]
MHPALETSLLAAAALVAGGVNAVAGGGSLLVYPSLLAVGLSPLTANGTMTLALVPGSLAGFWGHRGHLQGTRAWVVAMALPSLLGGALGTALALRAGDAAFGRMVPFLVLGATGLFALAEPIQRRLFVPQGEGAPQTRGRLAAMALFQTLVSVYGGFFGAGIGIVMLAALGLLGHRDIHRMNGLKNLAAAAINAVSSVAWVLAGRIAWRYGAVMALAAIVGGTLGARLARRVGPSAVRRAITVVGTLIGLVLLARAWRR